MVNPKMFRITRISQPVVAAPTVGMNHRLDADTSANNGLQRLSLNIRHDFGKDKTIAFVDTEDDVFAACAATASAAHPASTEIRFVNFDL